jgi:uncharacterized protein YjiS (DUF1127 family)
MERPAIPPATNYPSICASPFCRRTIAVARRAFQAIQVKIAAILPFWKAPICAASHILRCQTRPFSVSADMEDTMSTMSLDVLRLSPRRAFRWNHVRQTLASWYRHAHSRNELMGFSDRDSHDIGISRCTADFETSKPFWMA